MLVQEQHVTAFHDAQAELLLACTDTATDAESFMRSLETFKTEAQRSSAVARPMPRADAVHYRRLALEHLHQVAAPFRVVAVSVEPYSALGGSRETARVRPGDGV